MATIIPSQIPTTPKSDRRWKDLKSQLPNYLFVLPQLIFFVIFLVIPIFRGVQISMFDWKIMLTDQAWVGTANYQQLWGDKTFWQTMQNTIYFTVLTVGMNVILSLVVAVGLKQAFAGRDFFRVLFYAPTILSVSVIGIVAIRVWDTQLGIVNYFVTYLMGGPRISWLGNPSTVIPALALTTVWWTFGFPMLVFLAGLQNIPEQLYEAAKIDGAGRLRTFRNITLPLIMPSMLYVVVTQFISHMQVFVQPYVITGGGPGNLSRSTVQYLYETAWKFFRFGYASAIAVCLAATMIVITVILFRLLRNRTDY